MTDYIGPNGEKYSTNSIRARISRAAQEAADRIIEGHKLPDEDATCAYAASVDALSSTPRVRAGTAGHIAPSTSAGVEADNSVDITLATINCAGLGSRK